MGSALYLPTWMAHGGDNEPAAPEGFLQVYLSNADVPITCRVIRTIAPSPERFPFKAKIRVTRSLDLLDLVFEWTNVEAVAPRTVGETLRIRKKRGPAFLTVWFPPQYLAERVYSDPEEGPIQGNPPRLAAWNGATRLVFAIPEIHEESPLPYNLAALLNWEALLPSVVPHALPPDHPVTARVVPRALEVHETAIELPWGMLLSPDAGEEWLHVEPQPVSKDFKSRIPIKVELWHTKLIRKADPGRPDVPLSVRAVWSRDKEPEGPKELEALPSAEQRKAIVQQTSNFKLFYKDGHKVPTKHIDADRLLLSSQGAYAKLKVGWSLTAFLDVKDPPRPLDIVEWIHQGVWSREQYSKVSTLGYGMPCGSAITYDEEHQREFKDISDGTPVARVEGYKYCTVRQPVMEYERPPDGIAGVGRGWCYRRIEISPTKTPYLAGNPKDHGGWMVLRGFDGSQESHIFKFKITAWDWDGNRTEFELPLLWASKEAAEEGIGLPGLVAGYTKEAVKNRRKAILSGQKVAFAPSDENNARDVGLETNYIRFNVSLEDQKFPRGWIPKFYPQVEESSVRLAQTAAFDTSGADGRSIFSYNRFYLDAGFRHTGADGKAVNGTEVFADIFKEPTSAPPSLTFPGDKSGGLTTPSLDQIVHLSRVFGPVGRRAPNGGNVAFNAGPSSLVGGTFNAKEFLGAAAKLIGGVDLAEVIEDVKEAYDEIARVPKLVAETIKEIQTEVDEVRKYVDDIRQLLAIINDVRKGDLKTLSDAIREQVTHLVEGEAEKVRAKLMALILQEVRDYDAAMRAMKAGAETALKNTLTNSINRAAELFEQGVRDLWQNADAFFPFIFTALRDAEYLRQTVRKTLDEALNELNEYRQLPEKLKEEAAARITRYLQSPEFSAALGVTEFQNKLKELREAVLGPVTAAVQKTVPDVPIGILALAIQHPEVMAELAVAWRDPGRIRQRILDKVQTTLLDLAADKRAKIAQAVQDYFDTGAIKTELENRKKTLLQFRDHMLAKVEELQINATEKEKQIALLKSVFDPLKIRENFERALGSFDGLLDPIRGLPLGPLKNIISEFNRLQEDFKDPAKNLLNGELNRTLKQLGQAIEEVLKTGLEGSAKAVLKDTTVKLEGNLLNPGGAKGSLETAIRSQFQELQKEIGGLHADLRRSAPNGQGVQEFFTEKETEVVAFAAGYANAVADQAKKWQTETALLLDHIGKAAAVITPRLQDVMAAVKFVHELASKVENMIPKELAVDYAWEPKLKSSGAFEARRSGVPATFKLHARVRKSLLPAEIQKPPEVRVHGELRDFSLRLMPSTCFIIVTFKEVSFLSENGSKPKVVVKIDRVTFGEALKFVQELAKALSPESGFFIQLSGLGIEAGYRFALPNITSGGFNLMQVSINTAVVLPFDGSEVRVKFSLCDRQRPFLLSVGILGGGGFFGISLNARGVQTLEGSLEFGAVIALDIGVATGLVAVTAGIYFSQSGDNASLYGFVRATGTLRVIGLISISVQFYLGIGYERRDGKTLAVGEAVLTVEIEMLFFSVSVELRYRKEFEGSSDESRSRLTTLGKSLGGGALGEKLNTRVREYLDFQKNWRDYRSSFFSWDTANVKLEEIAL